MTSSVKGLLKGLRCIAQIFDQQKEPEMKIGLPTDVKHVAHIGWDGPSSTDPNWMSGFKSVPEIANQPSSSVKESKNPAKHLESVSVATQDTKPRSTTDKPKHKPRHKSSPGGDSVLDSPTKWHSDGSKQSRRSVDSPRGLNKSNLGDGQSTSHDPAGVPKSSRRKKSKAVEGPSKASKSKGGNSLPDTFPEAGAKTDTDQGMKNKEIKLSSVVETN